MDFLAIGRGGGVKAFRFRAEMSLVDSQIWWRKTRRGSFRRGAACLPQSHHIPFSPSCISLHRRRIYTVEISIKFRREPLAEARGGFVSRWEQHARYSHTASRDHHLGSLHYIYKSVEATLNLIVARKANGSAADRRTTAQTSQRWGSKSIIVSRTF